MATTTFLFSVKFPFILANNIIASPRKRFEFKYDKNFTNLKARSQIIAQTLYYVRRLKFDGFINKPIPPIICIADQNESILTETALWKTFYDDAQEKYEMQEENVQA